MTLGGLGIGVGPFMDVKDVFEVEFEALVLCDTNLLLVFNEVDDGVL